MAAQQAPAFEKSKLYDLPIIDINPVPDQPRKYMDPQALNSQPYARRRRLTSPVKSANSARNWRPV